MGDFLSFSKRRSRTQHPNPAVYFFIPANILRESRPFPKPASINSSPLCHFFSAGPIRADVYLNSFQSASKTGVGLGLGWGLLHGKQGTPTPNIIPSGTLFGWPKSTPRGYIILGGILFGKNSRIFWVQNVDFEMLCIYVVHHQNPR